VPTVDDWKDALRARIRAARSARSAGALTVLGDALAAVENAEALPAGAAAPPSDGPFAGSAAGLGAAEVPRRILSSAEVIAILEREVALRRAAAADYARLGRGAEADALRAQADVLQAFLEAPPRG
jgi:hypothetical protein